MLCLVEWLVNAHIQDGHAFRPQCLGQHVRCGGYLTDMLHLERHLLLVPVAPDYSAWPQWNRTPEWMAASLMYPRAVPLPAGLDKPWVRAKPTTRREVVVWLVSTVTVSPRETRLQLLVAILQHDLAHAWVAPARQLKRRDGSVVQVRIADKSDGHVSGR